MTKLWHIILFMYKQQLYIVILKSNWHNFFHYSAKSQFAYSTQIFIGNGLHVKLFSTVTSKLWVHLTQNKCVKLHIFNQNAKIICVLIT